MPVKKISYYSILDEKAKKLEDVFSTQSSEYSDITNFKNTMDNNEIITRLYKDFMPPIDREDLYCLFKHMDRAAVMLIHVKNLIHSNHASFSPELNELYDFLRREIIQLKDVISSMDQIKKSDKIRAYVINTNERDVEWETLYTDVAKIIFSFYDGHELALNNTILLTLFRTYEQLENIAHDISIIWLKNT